LAYLVGSIPVGVIVGKIYGFDPREVGSHNIGTTNVGRAGGKVPAALTFGGDVLKGLAPVLILRGTIAPTPGILAMAGFSAFTGSIASIFLRFRGGRGVATSVGVWLGMAPLPMLIGAGVFTAILAVSRVVSLASIGAAMSLPPAVAATHCPRPYILLAIAMSALVLLRHRENIERMMRGTETRIGSQINRPR
jgi:glycerol-3-phosphate acyltransferase PlsY